MAAVTEPVEVNNNPDMLDWVIGGAQILASLAAFGALLFLAQQVKHAKEQISTTREALKAERALAFQQRYTSRDFGRMVSPTLAFLMTIDAADCVDKIKGELTAPHAEAKCLPRTPRMADAPQASINDLTHVLSFFEDLGTAHDKELVDREVVLLSFGNAPVQIFMAAWWYIAWERGGGLGSDTKLHLEFEKHVRWLIETEAEFAEMKPNLTARLIVVPADTDAASWGSWQLCRDLSNALSAYPAPAETHIAAVTGAVEDIVGSAADEEVESLFGEVIPVPPALDVKPNTWSDERKQAERLERLLAGRDAHAIAQLVAQLNDAAAELRDASGEPDVPEPEHQPEHAHGGH